MRRRRHKKPNNKSNKLRLSLFKSKSNIYAQVIDDTKGITLASDNSLKEKNGGNVEAARAVGKRLAEKLKKANIDEMVCQASHRYHGRIAAVAETLRESGIKI